MCLSYGTLEEAMSTSQEGALTLCHSLRNMFELYCDVVPSYHKEKLNTMALLAGNIYIHISEMSNTQWCLDIIINVDILIVGILCVLFKLLSACLMCASYGVCGINLI